MATDLEEIEAPMLPIPMVLGTRDAHRSLHVILNDAFDR